MTKTDKSIHTICIASIKRSTMKPYDFNWTKFYESTADFHFSELEIDLAENELIICSTIIDKNNFSILTTKQLHTGFDGQLSKENIQGATVKLYVDVKRSQEKDFTIGQINLQNGNEISCFIETGKASMIMINGIRTFIEITGRTNKHTGGMTRIREKNEL